MRIAPRVGFALGILACGCAFGGPPAVKIDIGKDTTRVEGPVLADGTIDYPAAILAQMRAGLTAENDSWATMQKAIGLWRKFPRGTDDNSSMALIDEQDKALGRPWKTEECPDVAAWVNANEKALELVTKASAGGRLALPEHVDEKTGELTWEGLGSVREFGMALEARAMREVAAGEQDKARKDVATLHRLARQMMAEPLDIQIMIGEALDEMAWHAALVAITGAKVADAKQWLAESQAVPEATFNIAAVDMRERFTRLNMVMRIVRGHADTVLGDLTMLNLEGMFLDSKTGIAVNPGDLDQTDWNIVLRRINATLDAAVANLKIESPDARRAAWTVFEEGIAKKDVPGNFFDAMGGSLLNKADGDYDTQKKKMLDTLTAYLKRGPKETNAAFSERIAEYLTHDTKWIATEDEKLTNIVARQRATTIAMALAIYRAQKGSYPDSLDAVKETLGPMPMDPFTRKTFVYGKGVKGFRVYSVGANGKDDGGVRGTDDVVVELPK